MVRDSVRTTVEITSSNWKLLAAARKRGLSLRYLVNQALAEYLVRTKVQPLSRAE